MLLDDPRLDFASELILHWIKTRGSGLVPAAEYIDPEELLASVPFITIAEVCNPETATIQLAEVGLERRFGQDLRHANWFEFIHPALRRAAEQARRSFIALPCGIYYKYKASSDDRAVVREVETLGLPMKTLNSESPSRSISVTRDISFKGIADPATFATLRLTGSLARFVDIGAGIPDGLPICP